MGKQAVLVIKRNEQNNITLRCSSNIEVTSQQSEKILPTRLSKLNKSTCVCCSNLTGQYFKETLEISKLAGK